MEKTIIMAQLVDMEWMDKKKYLELISYTPLVHTTCTNKFLSKQKAIIFCLIYKIRNKNKIIFGEHINVRL